MTALTLLDRITKDGKLGKDTDKNLAKEYGVRQEEIGSIRRMLGIEPFCDRAGGNKQRVGDLVQYAVGEFAAGRNREQVIKDAAEKFMVKDGTVRSYLYWAKSSGVDIPSGLASGRRGRKGRSVTMVPYASLAQDKRIAQLEDMVLKVAISNTELLATLRQNGVIK